MVAPAVLSNMIGRRPILSESRPQIGAKTNCIAEKHASTKPMVRLLASKRFVNHRHERHDDAEPIRSMKTVSQTMSSDGFLIAA